MRIDINGRELFEVLDIANRLAVATGNKWQQVVIRLDEETNSIAIIPWMGSTELSMMGWLVSTGECSTALSITDEPMLELSPLKKRLGKLSEVAETVTLEKRPGECFLRMTNDNFHWKIRCGDREAYRNSKAKRALSSKGVVNIIDPKQMKRTMRALAQLGYPVELNLTTTKLKLTSGSYGPEGGSPNPAAGPPNDTISGTMDIENPMKAKIKSKNMGTKWFETMKSWPQKYLTNSEIQMDFGEPQTLHWNSDNHIIPAAEWNSLPRTQPKHRKGELKGRPTGKKWRGKKEKMTTIWTSVRMNLKKPARKLTVRYATQLRNWPRQNRSWSNEITMESSTITTRRQMRITPSE
jgi:hypothetical protein